MKPDTKSTQGVVKSIKFVHTCLTGDAYVAGQMQGEILRNVPGWTDFIRSGKGAFDSWEFEKVQRSFDRYFPGLNAEIAGLADATGIAPIEVIYYAATYQRAPGCSHLVVLPPACEDGHTWLARTYDFSDAEDDLRLCTTHIDGMYRHIGFSSMLFGRCDGINEHGLAVTMSSGGIPLRTPIQTGYTFWALVRGVLETCRTVDEGLAFFEEIPLSGNNIFLLVDRMGQAALVEVFGPNKAVKRIDVLAKQPYLCATNHYTLPEMLSYQPGKIMPNSQVRASTMNACLEQGPVSKKRLKALLGTLYPEGLSCHFYAEYFGTLHAMMFDVTTGKVEVCFGSPAANPWQPFDLANQVSAGFYPALLPQEPAGSGFFG